MSRVIDVQENNQLKYSFTGNPDTDSRACFNRSTWSPAVNLQQTPLGTSHLILGDSLVRVLQNLTERCPDRSSLMWSRPTLSPWHMYKEDLMKLNLQTVSFAADAIRMLNGARLSVNRQYSVTGVDWLIAAGINFSFTTALSIADLEGLPSNNTMGLVNARPLQDVKLTHDEGN